MASYQSPLLFFTATFIPIVLAAAAPAMTTPPITKPTHPIGVAATKNESAAPPALTTAAPAPVLIAKLDDSINSLVLGFIV